jgi:regulator of sigma D
MTDEKSDTPWHRLENKIVELLGTQRLHEEQIKNNREDIDEIRDSLRDYLSKETFEFYSRAFWILATAVGSGLIGSIFYVITRS